MIKKMVDSTQLIVIQGRITKVLSISSYTQFLKLKVALTLTVSLITDIGAVLRGVVLYLCLVKAVLQAVLLFFCQKKNDED